ncbi:MAG TPA: Gfo/Idh/MocA family oxidoreductase [Armatimonadota bacterium]|nr:Gfo/Idh/MocA family oxidoreductase [Armatimonadota bacterium]
MIKLGLVGGVDIFHGVAFSTLLNEKDEDAWKAAELWDPGLPPLENAAITAIWDPDHEVATRRAKLISGVESTPERMEDIIGTVDAVIVADDLTQQHQKRVPTFLEAGIPTFCDKPLSRDPAEAKAIVDLARQTGTRFMSSSALRFSRELEEAQGKLAEIGDIVTASAAGPSELIFYGVHPCELACTVLGPGAESVINVGNDAGINIVRVRWADGRQLVLHVGEGIGYVFEAVFYGAAGHCCIEVNDAGYFYQNMLRAFVNLVETGEEAVPPEDTLEIIRILAAAEKSLEQGSVELPVNPA